MEKVFDWLPSRGVHVISLPFSVKFEYPILISVTQNAVDCPLVYLLFWITHCSFVKIEGHRPAQKCFIETELQKCLMGFDHNIFLDAYEVTVLPLPGYHDGRSQPS